MDLAASSQWLIENVPAGAERTTAAAELAAMYARQSPQAGTAWLEELAGGPERDVATGAFAAAWSRTAPAQAAAWLATAGAPAPPPAAAETVARNCLLKDPQGFEAWRTALPE